MLGPDSLACLMARLKADGVDEMPAADKVGPDILGFRAIEDELADAQHLGITFQQQSLANCFPTAPRPGQRKEPRDVVRVVMFDTRPQ